MTREQNSAPFDSVSPLPLPTSTVDRLARAHAALSFSCILSGTVTGSDGDGAVGGVASASAGTGSDGDGAAEGLASASASVAC